MIEMVTGQTIDEVLPLIRKYQAFYYADQFDDQVNRMFLVNFMNILTKVVYLPTDRIKKLLLSQLFTLVIHQRLFRKLQY